MKKNYLAFFLFLTVLGNAQKQFGKLSNLSKIVTSEMKSLSNIMGVVANANTQNYDVTYHKLEFTVDPAVNFITGKITTTYTALANMNSIYFDLANQLTVSSVKKNGTNLTYTRNGSNELIIALPTTQTTGTAATLEITYSGTPPPSTNGPNAFTTQVRSNGSKTLYTDSQTFGSRDWWPCKQDLNDKINSIDVYITAPSQYIAVSNGKEPEAPIIDGATKTTHFHHGYPIPAYLICMAVTNYNVINQTAGEAPNQYPIINYIYPESVTSGLQDELAQTPLILNLFSDTFGIYPFHNEKYGHASWGAEGGMEHTTVSFMSMSLFDRALIAHECAHQWFGDKITCGTWKDIWLNEGFATYFAGFVVEQFDGNEEFVLLKSNWLEYITSEPDGAVYLTDTEATIYSRILDGRLTYRKGAMVLEMLRFKMGDVAFFQALRNYLADSSLAYGYAVTTNLKSHLEAVYGSSLTEFFNDWIYNQGYPVYTITAQNWGAGQAKIIVNQTQSHSSVSFFEMPLEIRLSGSGSEVLDVIVNNTSNAQEFIVSVPFVVTGVAFDPNMHIISKDNTATLANENFDINKAISFYPVPSENELTIQLPNNVILFKVEIYNNLGQLLATDFKNVLDISRLSSGAHFLKIETSEGVFHKNFIKK